MLENAIYYNFRTGRTYFDSGDYFKEALEIYLNLLSPGEVIQLEEGLRLVLQGKTKSYKQSEEHTRLFADPETTCVKSYIVPGTKDPIEGEYQTRYVYLLACDYNITERNMNILRRGGHIQTPSTEELKQKMDLIPPESD